MNGSLEAFDYTLNPESIAQEPAAKRGDSRLLVLERASGAIQHARFSEIGRFLRAGDLLVLNDTRVFPARLFARRATGGRVEVLLLEPIDKSGAWKALGKPARALRRGEDLELDGTAVRLQALGRSGAEILVRLHQDDRPLEPPEVFELCQRVGSVPLPPYIQRQSRPADHEQYQTVYARKLGAVAAPTAGLHFSAALLSDLETLGVGVTRITLHVGLGTFQPLTEETFGGATLPDERMVVPVEAGNDIRRARREKRRILAVGTTSVRALESFADDETLPATKRTDIFIKPGYRFRSVGGLITNFHLPKSSPLVLVSAFAGRDVILDTYAEASRAGYRFYSYGDAMLVL